MSTSKKVATQAHRGRKVARYAGLAAASVAFVGLVSWGIWEVGPSIDEESESRAVDDVRTAYPSATEITERVSEWVTTVRWKMPDGRICTSLYDDAMHILVTEPYCRLLPGSSSETSTSTAG